MFYFCSVAYKNQSGHNPLNRREICRWLRKNLCFHSRNWVCPLSVPLPTRNTLQIAGQNSINCNLWETSSLIPPEASCCHHWWKDSVMHFKSKVLRKYCLDKAVQMDCLMYKFTAVTQTCPSTSKDSDYEVCSSRNFFEKVGSRVFAAQWGFFKISFPWGNTSQNSLKVWKHSGTH